MFKNNFYKINFFLCVIMDNNTKQTYYQKHKQKILEYAQNYYNENKDIIKQKRDDLPQEKKKIQ